MLLKNYLTTVEVGFVLKLPDKIGGPGVDRRDRVVAGVVQTRSFNDQAGFFADPNFLIGRIKSDHCVHVDRKFI